ncbi:MAG: hypothetical protein ACRYFR_11015 [Janthinobacterium lividum]
MSKSKEQGAQWLGHRQLQWLNKPLTKSWLSRRSNGEKFMVFFVIKKEIINGPVLAQIEESFSITVENLKYSEKKLFKRLYFIN